METGNKKPKIYTLLPEIYKSRSISKELNGGERYSNSNHINVEGDYYNPHTEHTANGRKINNNLPISGCCSFIRGNSSRKYYIFRILKTRIPKKFRSVKFIKRWIGHIENITMQKGLVHYIGNGKCLADYTKLFGKGFTENVNKNYYYIAIKLHSEDYGRGTHVETVYNLARFSLVRMLFGPMYLFHLNKFIELRDNKKYKSFTDLELFYASSFENNRNECNLNYVCSWYYKNLFNHHGCASSLTTANDIKAYLKTNGSTRSLNTLFGGNTRSPYDIRYFMYLLYKNKIEEIIKLGYEKFEYYSRYDNSVVRNLKTGKLYSLKIINGEYRTNDFHKAKFKKCYPR